MKSICKKCSRVIISTENKEYCGDCEFKHNQNKKKEQWLKRIEEIEINKETIKRFMGNHIDWMFLASKNTVQICNYIPPIIGMRGEIRASGYSRAQPIKLWQFDPLTDNVEYSAFLNRLFQTVKRIKKVGERQGEGAVKDNRKIEIEYKTPEEIKQQPKSLADELSWEEKKAFNHLSQLILGCKNSTTLEKNWQIVVNNPLYTITKKENKESEFNTKKVLDMYYISTKNCIKDGNFNKDNDNNRERERERDKFHNYEAGLPS